MLKDGTVIRGIYGRNSRASSDPDRRDLFLEGILMQGAKGRWQVDPHADGLWIDGNQIVTIKFVVVKRSDENGERMAPKSSGRV